MINNRKVFITGSTGALGSKFTKSTLENGKSIILLIRAVTIEQASKKIEKFLGANLLNKYQNVIDIVLGDLNNLTNIEDYIDEIYTVINIAGNVHLGKDEDKELEEVNIKGIENLLNTCSRMPNLEYLMHTSTFYVSELFDKYDFVNKYEETKKKAEEIINNFADNNLSIRVSIVRPSIIIGDSKNGEILNCSGLCGYVQILYSLLKRKDSFTKITLPGVENAPANLVFVDWVVNQMNIILQKALTGTYNLANQNPPTISWLMNIYVTELKLDTEITFDNNPIEQSVIDKMAIKFGANIFKDYLSRFEVPTLNPKLEAHPIITKENIVKQVEFYKKNFVK